MQLFTQPKTFADAQAAIIQGQSLGFDMGKPFPIINIRKCKVDPKSLDIWQVPVKSPITGWTDEQDLIEQLKEVTSIINSL